MSKFVIGSSLVCCLMGVVGCGAPDDLSLSAPKQAKSALSTADAGTANRADVPLTSVSLSSTHKIMFYEYAPGDIAVVEEGNLDSDPPVSTTRLSAARPMATLYRSLVPVGAVPPVLVQADERVAAAQVDGGSPSALVKVPGGSASPDLTASNHETRDFDWASDNNWFLTHFCNFGEEHQDCFVGRTGDVYVRAFDTNVQIFGFNSSLSGTTSRFYVEACDTDFPAFWNCSWHMHTVVDLQPRFYTHYWSGNTAKTREAHIEPLVGNPREDFAYSYDDYHPA